LRRQDILVFIAGNTGTSGAFPQPLDKKPAATADAGRAKITFREAGRKTEVDYSDIKRASFFKQRGFDCAQLHGILIFVPSSVAVAPHPLDGSWIPSRFRCPPGERLVMLGLSLFEMFDVGMILGLIRQAVPGARMSIGLPVSEQESRKMRAGLERAGSISERNE
jgi:hypothetical protein